MLGPKHVPTHIQTVNFENDLFKHHKKLEEIHKSTKNKEFVDLNANAKTKLFETRDRSMKFHNSEKALAIEKDNELLLGKLVEISRKKKTAADFKTEKHPTGTLNAPARKREKDRIAAENEAFARRLLSQQPSFNRKKLDLDYGKHNERVKSMQKVSMFSPRKIKLPPIKKEETKTKRSKSGTDIRDKKKIEQAKEEEEEEERREQAEREEKERIEKAEAEQREQQEREAQEAAEKKRQEEEEKQRREKEEREAQEKAAREAEAREKAEREAKAGEEQPQGETAQPQEQPVKEETAAPTYEGHSRPEVTRGQEEPVSAQENKNKSTEKIAEHKDEQPASQ